MDFVLYAILLLIIGWFIYSQFVPVKGLRNLNAEQFKKEIQGNRLIDVREVHEFKQGHIPGAVNIPLSQVRRRLDEIPKDSPVYLYCKSGMRSKQAGKVLSKNGFCHLAHLSGGIMAWSGPLKK